MRPRRAGARARRGLAVAPLALLAAVAGGVLSTTPARADDTGYRYWSFWEGDETAGTWTYATQGPATARVGDGDVVGFRFAVSVDSSDAHQPRDAADFAAVCGGVAEGTGEGGARVALVLDHGLASHAPDGERPPPARAVCATGVADGATAAEVLAAVAQPLRYGSGGLLCAIEGYPERGCGETVSLAEGGDGEGDGAEQGAAAGENDESGESGGDGGSGGSAVAAAVGVGVVAFLAVAAVRRSRQRRG
ncbi:SCO2322 family protein [Streptomyces sp. 4N509B]|uniref:SCO2322 family protein n=1 Tax=Streptomyces sp. 4N509B TaxID=3457413 RepID=UPI003FD2DA1B